MDHPRKLEIRGREFLQRHYHNPSHRSVDLIGIGPSSAKGGAAGRRDNEYQGGRHVWVSFPSGHGVHSVWMPPNPTYVETFQDNRIVADYFRHCHHERTRRLGDKARLLPFTGTIFSECVVSRPPAARLMRLAPGQRDADRDVAFLPGRSRRAGRGQGPLAPLLHALRRPSRDDQAGPRLRGRRDGPCLRDIVTVMADCALAARATPSRRWPAFRSSGRRPRPAHC
jgi:hypothetical protein